MWFILMASKPVAPRKLAAGHRQLTLCSGFRSQSLPSPFAVPQHRSTKRPTSLLSHLVFTHQTTLSPSDVEMYDGDAAGAEQEIRRLERQGVRLFGVGGVGSELVEWDWGGPGAAREVGRVKVSQCVVNAVGAGIDFSSTRLLCPLCLRYSRSRRLALVHLSP